MRHHVATLLWRALLAAALLCGIGLLPWLSRTDPALTALKARSADRDPTPRVLADIRAQLGLDQGPLQDRKSTRQNSSHGRISRMPSSA